MFIMNVIFQGLQRQTTVYKNKVNSASICVGGLVFEVTIFPTYVNSDAIILLLGAFA